MVQVGCGGFPLAQARYFRAFGLLEGQQTFYQPPRLTTLQRCRATAPEGFEFTLKAWQLITHEPSSPTYRRYTTTDEDLRRLLGWCNGEVYCLFNNVTMAADAQRFQKLLPQPGKP